MNILLQLYATWFKMGLFTFGGGYAMLPMIQREVIEKHKWATEEEVMDYYAIGQCTPGIIAVNTATFIGYKLKGVIGAIVATLGVVSPSLIIITIIASVLTNFAEIPVVQHALSGINVGVCVLMTVSILKLFRSNIKDNWGIAIFAAAFVLAYFCKIDTVILCSMAGITGVAIQAAKAKGLVK